MTDLRAAVEGLPTEHRIDNCVDRAAVLDLIDAHRCELDVKRLREALPYALAAADDAGSQADDWVGSEYVDRMVASLAERLGPPPDERLPTTILCDGMCGVTHGGHI